MDETCLKAHDKAEAIHINLSIAIALMRVALFNFTFMKAKKYMEAFQTVLNEALSADNFNVWPHIIALSAAYTFNLADRLAQSVKNEAQDFALFL